MGNIKYNKVEANMKYPLLKPKYYTSLFFDILNFIKNPDSKKDDLKAIKFKIYDTIGLFILKTALLIPASILIGVIHDPENLTKSNMAERFSPLILIVITVFILPTIEEICFRLSLNFKPKYLALSFGVFTYYVLTKAVYQTKISMIDDSFSMRIVISLGLVGVTYILLQSEFISNTIQRIWVKHFRFIYYLSCLTFAWIHVFNYELNWTNIMFLPLITLPQLMSAIISGYTRVRYGFQYPLIFHYFTNAVAISIYFLPFTD